AANPALAKQRTREHNMTILIFAARYGNLKIVRMLLDRGADPNARDELGNTALHAAARHSTLPVVKLLVARGARVDVRNRTDQTPAKAAEDEYLYGAPEGSVEQRKARMMPVIDFLKRRE
ncbi:MAG: ankyrin repeat domain-containing protein, partial [Proteobacteria bacterium]|nr:ankyrin repeat domain-containing protein [Pseudomonadota bacterium]